MHFQLFCIKVIKRNKLFLVLLMLAANSSTAQASTYKVDAIFSDGGIQGQTLFNGQFDWDGSSVSNFSGGLTQAMWAWDQTKGEYTSRRGSDGSVGAAPVLDLAYQLDGTSSADGDGDVAVSVFFLNDTNVFMGGGYNLGDSYKYGFLDGNTPNENAYFTLSFNATDPTNTATAKDKIVYGDATPFGLMGPLLYGPLAMTGHSGYGSMGGAPWELSITAVPIPATSWLFGAAIASLIGVSRKRILGE